MYNNTITKDPTTPVHGTIHLQLPPANLAQIFIRPVGGHVHPVLGYANVYGRHVALFLYPKCSHGSSFEDDD